MTDTRTALRDLLAKHDDQFSVSDRKYLRRCFDSFQEPHADPFAYFYILPKIHKTPWKTRPIVSVPGSLLHGLGRWVDKQLQKIAPFLPAFFKSSYDLKQELLSLQFDWSRCSLFSADADSMYTNIDTAHAIPSISQFLLLDRYGRYIVQETKVHVPLLIDALSLIMGNNHFRFDDTYWHQISGTAMGTPPACMYATLYYAVHEISFLRTFRTSIPFYKRFIDDVVGIWFHDPDPIKDLDNWNAFQATLPYGSLTWNVTDRARQLDFMDLTIHLPPPTASRIVPITTSLYEKPQNLYLYLPPHSAHPRGVFKGTVIGSILRIFRLSSTDANRKSATLAFYRRLRARGYSSSTLKPIFRLALHKALSPATTIEPRSDPSTTKYTNLHLTYHPQGPSRRQLQQLFSDRLLHPESASSSSTPPLWTLRNQNSCEIGYNALRIIYHRPRTLRNLLFPRRFKPINEQSRVSTYCPDPPDTDEHTVPTNIRRRIRHDFSRRARPSSEQYE